MCPTGTTLLPATAISQYRRAFNVIDADHDGKISGDDLKTFYASLSATANGGAESAEEDAIKAMMSVADANKDGFVQYDEFERVLKGKDECKSYGGGRGVMEEVFRVMDQDGDGRLGFEDLRSYLGRAGLRVGDEKIKAMIRLGGGDEKDGVSFDGFVDILAIHDLVN